MKKKLSGSVPYGTYVVVRTTNAGVHIGHLARREGQDVTLTQGRRIWEWTGANTLHEISLYGVGPGSKVSEAVPLLDLMDAIEVIPCSSASEQRLKATLWTT